METLLRMSIFFSERNLIYSNSSIQSPKFYTIKLGREYGDLENFQHFSITSVTVVCWPVPWPVPACGSPLLVSE